MPDTPTLGAQQIIDLYADHGTHEQFHSEIETDMDLGRLPSGKIDTNYLVCALADPAPGTGQTQANKTERRSVKRDERVGASAPRDTEVGGAVLPLGHHQSAEIGALMTFRMRKLRLQSG